MPISNPLSNVSGAIWTSDTLGQYVPPNISMADYNTMIDHMRRYNKVREPVTVASEEFRTKALAMRLRITQGEEFPFEALYTAHSGDKVFCFLVVKGSPVVIEDESVLFPSDTLITQLRMLME